MTDSWKNKLHDPSPWVAPRPRPKPVETGNIVVRVYDKGDGPALFEAISAQREALLPWMAWAELDHQSVDDSIHFVERTRRAAEASDCLNFNMGIFDGREGTLLGGTGLHRIHPGYREAEIGYWVRGDRQRSGICTRAIGALISSALTSREEGGWGFRRIVIYNAVKNVASRRVCEHLGLRLELCAKKDRYLAPLGYLDTLGFAVLADEWDFETDHAKSGIGFDPAAEPAV